MNTSYQDAAYATAPVKKKTKSSRLYGVLGIDRLNPDDNILQRGTLNTNKDTSLSHKKDGITKSELKNDENNFKLLMNMKEKEFKKIDREIRIKKIQMNSKEMKVLTVFILEFY